MPPRPRRLLSLLLALIVVGTALGGCARVRTALALQPDDTVTGEIVVATPEQSPDDKGPAITVPAELRSDVEVSATGRTATPARCCASTDSPSTRSPG